MIVEAAFLMFSFTDKDRALAAQAATSYATYMRALPSPTRHGSPEI